MPDSKKTASRKLKMPPSKLGQVPQSALGSLAPPKSAVPPGSAIGITMSSAMPMSAAGMGSVASEMHEGDIRGGSGGSSGSGDSGSSFIKKFDDALEGGGMNLDSALLDEVIKGVDATGGGGRLAQASLTSGGPGG